MFNGIFFIKKIIYTVAITSIKNYEPNSAQNQKQSLKNVTKYQTTIIKINFEFNAYEAFLDTLYLH